MGTCDFRTVDAILKPFEKLDINRDFYLDRPEGGSKVSNFDSIDFDKDGKISLAEWFKYKKAEDCFEIVGDLFSYDRAEIRSKIVQAELKKIAEKTGITFATIQKLNEKYGTDATRQLLKKIFSKRGCEEVSALETFINNGGLEILGRNNFLRLLGLAGPCSNFLGELNKLQESGKLKAFGPNNLMEIATNLKQFFPHACKYINAFEIDESGQPWYYGGLQNGYTTEWREIKDFIIRFFYAITATNQRQIIWLGTARARALDALVAKDGSLLFPLKYPEITFQDLVEFVRMSGIYARLDLPLLSDLSMSVIGRGRTSLDMSEVLKIMRLSYPSHSRALQNLYTLRHCLTTSSVTPAKLVQIAEREKTNTDSKYAELVAQLECARGD